MFYALFVTIKFEFYYCIYFIDYFVYVHLNYPAVQIFLCYLKSIVAYDR